LGKRIKGDLPEPPHIVEVKRIVAVRSVHDLSGAVLSFGELFSVSVGELKAAWQKPLDW